MPPKKGGDNKGKGDQKSGDKKDAKGGKKDGKECFSDVAHHHTDPVTLSSLLRKAGQLTLDVYSRTSTSTPSSTTMESLPAEIIEKILGYLVPSDRLAASEVSLSWFEASLSPLLWKDIALVIESCTDRAIAALGNTRKPVQHVIIKDVNFTSCDGITFKFWENICQKIVSLEVNQCYLTEANLLNLLIPCKNLEILHFHNCRDIFITGQLFCNPLVLLQVKTALPNLKEICFLDNGSYLTDALVDRFISLISELKSLGFAGTSVSFHPGIHKRFYSQNSKNQQSTKSSELVLTFDCILHHVRTNAKTVKHLDFSRTLINDKSCLLLSQVENLELRSLLLRSCEVGQPGVNAICATQSSITELDLSFCARVTDTALNSICTNLANLRKLSIQSCRAVTDVGVTNLCQLQHLSDVNLQGLERITPEGIEKGLIANANLKLRRLNLAATHITEDTLQKLAINAPNLKYLNVTSCIKAVTDSSLKVLWKSLRNLSHLLIDWCPAVTDYGFMTNDSKKNINDVPYEPQCHDGLRTISCLNGLVHLSLSGCNRLSDLSLAEAFCFRDIRYLGLEACSLITDEGLIKLASNNSGIEILNLNYCSRLTDSALSIAFEKMPRLRKLELHGCLQLTSRTLEEIQKKLRYLIHLDISHCKLISFDSALQFHSRMPSIKVLGTSGLV